MHVIIIEKIINNTYVCLQLMAEQNINFYFT